VTREEIIGQFEFYVKQLFDQQILAQTVQADNYAKNIRKQCREEVARKWFWSAKRKEQYVAKQSAKYIHIKFEETLLKINRLKRKQEIALKVLVTLSDQELKKQYYHIFGEEGKWTTEGF
tara:strand:+ start:256 stop:615 length:360 start_codon:yes stop_codon:yes gene_type:complete